MAGFAGFFFDAHLLPNACHNQNDYFCMFLEVPTETTAVGTLQSKERIPTVRKVSLPYCYS